MEILFVGVVRFFFSNHLDTSQNFWLSRTTVTERSMNYDLDGLDYGENKHNQSHYVMLVWHGEPHLTSGNRAQ